MQMKASWAALFLAANAFAAGYVPWQASYELWMPVITASSNATVLTQPSKQLPFVEPAASFSPAPVYQKVPFDPAGALVVDQKFFAAAAPMSDEDAWRLQLEGQPAQNVPGLTATAALPEELVAVKAGGLVTLLASWPAQSTPQDRQKLLECAQKALSEAPDGQYGGHLSRH